MFFFQCASTNQNILTLSSIWPVKSTCFFGWNAPARVLFEEIMYCHMVYVVKYIYYLYWVYSWSPEKSEKTKSNSLERKYSVNIFYLIGKIAVFFSVCIHKSKYFDIIFYMTCKKHKFFSAGMPQPGFFLKKFWIAISYMWSKCHIDMYFVVILNMYIFIYIYIHVMYTPFYWVCSRGPQKKRKNKAP